MLKSMEKNRMWYIEPNSVDAVKNTMNNLATVFSLAGETVSKSSISEVVKVTIDKKNYFVKKLYKRGKSWRRFLGRSRVRGEWENMFYFKSKHIPTASIVAYGEITTPHFRGALITKEIDNTIDLAKLVKNHSKFLSEKNRFQLIFSKLAKYLATLHSDSFILFDFKARNILISMSEPLNVYLIDCPIGRKRSFLFLKHGILRDLYTFEHSLKNHISEQQFNWFLEKYCEFSGKNAKELSIAYEKYKKRKHHD